MIEWLLSDEDFNSLTKNMEDEDAFNTLWDNGITSKKDAQDRMGFYRFQYMGEDCPFCETIDSHYKLSDDRFKCKKCMRKFSLTTGTYLESTKLECYHWIRFAYMVGQMKITNSVAIARDLGVTQTTSWGMLKLLKDSRKKITGGVFRNGHEALAFKHDHEVLDILLSKKKAVAQELPAEVNLSLDDTIKEIEQSQKKTYEFGK